MECWLRSHLRSDSRATATTSSSPSAPHPSGCSARPLRSTSSGCWSAPRPGRVHRRGGRHGRPAAALPGFEPRLRGKHLQRAVRAGSSDHRPAALIAERMPARAGAAGRRAADSGGRGRPRRNLLLHPGRSARHPWWAPLVAFAAMAALFGVMQRVARHRREGFWTGIAVLRGMRGASPDHRPRLRRGRAADRPQLAAAQLEWRQRLGVRLDRSSDRPRRRSGSSRSARASAPPRWSSSWGRNGVAAEAAAGALLDGDRRRRRTLLSRVWAVVDRLWMRPEPAAAPVLPVPVPRRAGGGATAFRDGRAPAAPT